ncbi:hypothetical protein EV643_15610 [Kribbella sp. VKM Ac-2527]|uniref:Uncharacterized protein n=1 Tax=Kribbella caucasensis TaxID=2512215 RepID=A0A4R6IZY6_9ACTN|nr:hypothetical protein EV643_15610 [Kribbella sp. VKM Ac-2527]
MKAFRIVVAACCDEVVSMRGDREHAVRSSRAYGLRIAVQAFAARWGSHPGFRDELRL